MARRRLTREEARERTRARLIEAAAKVIARRGFHAATLDDIAEEAGYTKGAVYSNFDSKEDLFLTLLEERTAARLDDVRRAFAGIGSLADIRAEAEAFAALVDEERELWLLSVEFWSYAARDPAVRRRVVRLYERWRRSLADLIVERASALGLPLSAEPRTLAAAAIALTEGFALQRILDPRGVDTRALGEMQTWLFTGAAVSAVGEGVPAVPASALAEDGA